MPEGVGEIPVIRVVAIDCVCSVVGYRGVGGKRRIGDTGGGKRGWYGLYPATETVSVSGASMLSSI